MHVAIELAIFLVTGRHRAMVSRVADWIPAAVRLSAREASCQVPKSIQFLAIEPSIMARGAPRIRTFPTEVMIVAELLMSKPRDDRLHGSDGRINSLTMGVSKDDWLRPAN